jgi:uncharacterized lipoprotein YddW (UPF0748 family)
MRRREVAAAAALALAGCAVLAPPPTQTPLREDEWPPSAPREFRAAWVASVDHIDWPSRRGLAPVQQREEAIAMLDRARSLGLNAMILQVRPAGDALYASALEPWSEYLTGEQGRAPQPLWDPLAFWVEQAHLRGLELHAWFNPYRARHFSATTPLVAPHLAVTQPLAVKPYGDMSWMDPAEPASAERLLAVVADVVRRHDVDGIHIDDYFYPYPIKQDGAEVPFPDEPAWRRYQAGGGRLARAPWRRNHVDLLVQALYRTVHEIKPHVRVGISPFGIGKPTLRPAGVTGFSQYDTLYADVERWLQEGWLDYLVPQLYWPIAREGQAFPVLLDYWLAQNPKRRHIWPGQFTSMVGAPLRAWPAGEILDQVALVRNRKAAGGQVHFSMIALMQDRGGVATRLQREAYARPALAPATPWLGDAPPAAPAPTLRRGWWHSTVHSGTQRDAFVLAVWRRRNGAWLFEVQPAHDPAVPVEAEDDLLVISAIDRLGNESERKALRLR